MGDLFFVLKMMIYTLILVVLLQVKVGPTTMEQKLQHLTHNSQLAGTLQAVAQGAATFVGAQYNRLAGSIHSKYIKKHSADNRPGERLQMKLDQLKESLNKKWEQETVERSMKEEP
jgi:hypothetical protein